MKLTTLNPARRWIIARQLLFATISGVSMVVVDQAMYSMLRMNGLNGWKIAMFILFVILSFPIILSFWTGVIGFMVKLRGGDSTELTRNLDRTAPVKDLPRTAIIVPVYNEDPVRVIAGVKATYKSLEATGLLEHFEFFILSDTTDPDTWVREELALVDFRQTVSDPSRVFYRNRRENVDRKTGNIADFCAGWGGRYRYMIVFDADSIMTGNCLVDLVRMMEKHPEAGIIQAPPLPVNRHTFFGRMRQFATHAYSSIFLTGLNFWQGGAANYWGHNAIIRIAPFVEHCRLPKLSGPEPLGGSILSHDFVEAAFMRRAGWKVYLASELRGSYEEVPPSLITYAARDRRWCQGNMQHTKLLTTPGLHPVNRLHMCLGIMAYLAAPLWMLMLLISTIEGIRESVQPHVYFPQGPALHPVWNVSIQTRAIALFVSVMGLLMTPKVLSLISHLMDRKDREEYGGAGNLIKSVLLETVFATLLAPVLAFLQTHFVVGIFMGKNIKWDAQDRGDAQTTLGEAISRHWPATLLGVVWTVLLVSMTPKLFWWFSPVLAGFWLAIPMSFWSSRVNAGENAKAHGLFLTPEEVHLPQVLADLDTETAWASQRVWAKEGDALERILRDPSARAVHLALIANKVEQKDDLRRHYIEGLELKYQHDGAKALTPREKRDLLWDKEAIQDLLAQTTGTANLAMAQ